MDTSNRLGADKKFLGGFIMKKTLSFVLVAAMLLCMIPAFGIFADEVIEISTAEEFLAIANKLDGNYKLTKDITLDNQFVGLKADGGVDEGKYFKGTFDGNGKTITLKLTTKDGNRTGIFAQADGATIKNLKVVADINLTADTGSNGNSCSAVVGTAKNSAAGRTLTFENVQVSGTIKSTDESLACGALIGAIEGNGTIAMTNCKSTATINSSARGKDNGGGIGGLIGSARSGGIVIKITDCVVNGTVKGTDFDGIYNGNQTHQDSHVGGFIGYLRDTSATVEITGGSVAGSVTGAACAGGVIGAFPGAITVTIDSTKITATISATGVTGNEIGSAAAGATVTINPYVEPETPDTPDTPDAPETGDFMVVAVLLSVVALAGVAVVSKKRIAC